MAIHQNLSYQLDSTSSLESKLQEIENSLSDDPKSIQKLLEKGSILFQLQRYSESMQVFDMVLDIDPKNAHALRYKGYIYEILGNHASAFQYFYTIYRFNNTDIDTISSMSYNILKLKTPNPSLALIYLDQALKIDPNHTDSLVVKGLALNAMGLYDNSKTYFQSVLDRFPDNIMAQIGLAERDYLMGDYKTAKEKFLQISKKHPLNLDALMGLGKSTLGLAIVNSKDQGTLDMQNFIEANNTFIKLTQSDKNNADYVFYIGETYFEMAKFNSEKNGVFDTENYKHALPYFIQYIDQNPRDTNTLQKIAESYHAIGKYEESIKYYDLILKINPTHGLAKIGKLSSMEKLQGSGNVFNQYDNSVWIIMMSILSIFVFVVMFKLQKITSKKSESTSLYLQ